MAVKVEDQVRPLREIAAEIREEWATLATAGAAAQPYVVAMAELDRIDGAYYADSAEAIVRYFLANAGAWRGEVARRVKGELRSMLA